MLKLQEIILKKNNCYAITIAIILAKHRRKKSKT